MPLRQSNGAGLSCPPERPARSTSAADHPEPRHHRLRNECTVDQVGGDRVPRSIIRARPVYGSGRKLPWSVDTGDPLGGIRHAETPSPPTSPDSGDCAVGADRVRHPGEGGPGRDAPTPARPENKEPGGLL